MNVFMIICHKNPIQVERLIHVCKTKFTDVILHVDANMNLDDFSNLKSSINRCVKKFGGGYT